MSRVPTPDLARGLMLALIAVANAPHLLDPLRTAGVADQVWLVVRTGLVDQRVYPVFAFFLGFGLARQSSQGQNSHGQGRHQLARLRRRGLVLLGLGAVHALVFSGDILGAYGVLVLTLAVAVVRRQRGLLMSLALLVTLVTLVASTQPADQDQWGPAWEWVLITLGTPWLSLVLPAAVAGVLAHDLHLVERLPRWRWAPVAAVAGLALGMVTSLPVGLALASAPSASAGTGGTSDQVAVWWLLLAAVGTLASVVGWVALCAALARSHRWVGVLGPLGRRSLSGYLAQSVLLTAVSWSGVRLGLAAGAGVALVVWVALVLIAWALDRRGWPGPAEALVQRLLRRPAAR